jgi:hypothetical protein
MPIFITESLTTRRRDAIVDGLNAQAQSYSNMSRQMAEAKSLRQGDCDPPRADLYAWTKPEDTEYGKLAALFANMKTIDLEQATMELAYAFNGSTHGDHIKVWWSSLEPKQRDRYLTSTKAALGLI